MSLFAPASIGDLAIRVLLIQPHRLPVVEHRRDTTIGEGRTTIEERRSARSGLLLTQSFNLLPMEEELDDWRKGLAALGATLVAVPLWADCLPVDRWSERIYDPTRVINFTPGTDSFAIYAADDPPESWPYSHLAPLLIGRWVDRPSATALSDRVAEIRVKIVEASPWNCRIGIHAHGDAWIAEPNWSTPPEEINEYDLETIALEGVAAREVSHDRTNAAPRWRQSAGFTFIGRLEIRAALSWFDVKKGSTHAWSGLPAWMTPGDATGVTPHSYTARFASDTLTLTYGGGESATAKIGFIQQLDTGERAQEHAAETYLYTLSYEHDSENPELWTNWDEPLTATEGTFEPSQLVHQEVLRSLRPQDVKAEITMAFRQGSLMADWQLGRLFGGVTLTIEQCDPDDLAASRRMLFRGRVKNVLPDGNMLRVTAKLLGDFFEARVPAWEYGPDCQTWVFSSDCGLSEETHKSEGTAARADLSEDGMTLTVHTVSGWGGTSYAAQWFAHGVLRTGAGRTTQMLSIMTSVMSGGNLVLTLARPMWADMLSDSGQTVTLLPGCGQQWESDCGSKFNNQANFRGDPHIPDYLETIEPGSPKTPKK